MDAIYLTEGEQAFFNKLPEALRESWEIKNETGTAYETDEVLSMRRKMTSFDEFPAVKNLLLKMQNGEENLSLDGIPESVLAELFFAIGARGLSVLIGRLLTDAKSDADLEGMSGLSAYRHEILETNSSVSFV